MFKILLITLLVSSCSKDYYTLEFQEHCRQLAENYLYQPYKTYKRFNLSDSPVCEIFYIDGTETPSIRKQVYFESIKEMKGALKVLKFKSGEP